MGRKKKRKTSLVNYHPENQIWEDKICYVCNKEIIQCQRFYAIGKNKKGIELYRHQKCKAKDYKGEH